MNGRSADDHFALIRAARIGRTAASGAATQGVASGNAECERRGPQAEVTTRAFPSNLTGVVLDPPGRLLLFSFAHFQTIFAQSRRGLFLRTVRI
jgi:hypothetical protein